MVTDWTRNSPDSETSPAEIRSHDLMNGRGNPEAGFLVAVLDVGTNFEVTFQRVGAQNMQLWLV